MANIFCDCCGNVLGVMDVSHPMATRFFCNDACKENYDEKMK